MKNKKLIDEYKKAQEKEFEDSLPMERQLFYELFDYLDDKSEKIECKHDFSLTNEFLKAKNIESENVINHLKKDTYVICLDLKGKQFSSEEFAQDIQDISMLHSNITFIIGGSLGMSEKLLNLANQKICFSKMTFPHQLIRVFLLEQIYRAFKIINGENYHK